jgi:hypothetical protein
MLKKFRVILFLIPMLAQTFSGFVLKADYFLNISSYLEKCINRGKPELKCNGQCQLVKKIDEANQDDEGSSTGNSVTYNEVLSSKSYPPYLKFGIEPVRASWSSQNTYYIPWNYRPDIFQPPQLS